MPIVPETFYPPPYHAAADTYGYIQSQTLTYTPVGASTPITVTPLGKAIIELFDNYGRVNATLGTEITDWNAIPAASTGYGFPYIDPPNDILLGFSNIDPATGQAFATPTTNVMYNFGWEYVWHCHLLGHEENDMMRPLVFRPTNLHGWVDLLLLF